MCCIVVAPVGWVVSVHYIFWTAVMFGKAVLTFCFHAKRTEGLAENVRDLTPQMFSLWFGCVLCT